MNVALLGGSFNPPHIGHLLAAVYVHASAEVDEVWLMPAFRHPFGKPLVEFDHRVRMCERLALHAGAWLRVTEVEREVDAGGRTVDTLEHLIRKRPNDAFTLVLGSDLIRDLPQWKDVERLRELAPFLVLHRAGEP